QRDIRSAVFQSRSDCRARLASTLWKDTHNMSGLDELSSIAEGTVGARSTPHRKTTCPSKCLSDDRSVGNFLLYHEPDWTTKERSDYESIYSGEVCGCQDNGITFRKTFETIGA